MKIGCDACERAEAAVLCCADEAALCRSCDAAVHSANKLAGRHHRVALLPSSTARHPSPSAIVDDGSGAGHPACDICQEKTGYFFCLEDRALLCRPCDVAVHAAGAHVSSHRRFLITGVRVGDVESLSHHVPGSEGVSPSPRTSSGNGSSSAPCSSGGNPMTTTMPGQVRLLSSVRATAPTTEGSDGQQWLWSEFLADDVGVGVGVDMDQCCHAELSEPGSSGITRC
ncbi:B-box zinc finger protein 22-like [Miscanthus floridulus]|uniref:B-box zinc finger protein 22-like n=1 Tax=Miscanthus floridulus TaxID=154761 RepID=UPI0034599FF7